MTRLLILLAILSSTACGHMLMDPDTGDYICKTKPRTYINGNGVKMQVVDYYSQGTPCPQERIE